MHIFLFALIDTNYVLNVLRSKTHFHLLDALWIKPSKGACRWCRRLNNSTTEHWSTTILANCDLRPPSPATHLSKTSRLRVSLVLVGVLRVFWSSSTFFFRLCRQTNKTTDEGEHCFTWCGEQQYVSYWWYLTEISLSARDRSICTNFMSSLFWLSSREALRN